MPTLHSAAVDLGATSGRVILGTWSRNRLTLNEVHRFPNAFRSLGSHDYWDVAGLWHEVQTGLAKAMAALPKGGKLASVGVDTWGVDYALVDASGRLVFPVHAYRDSRTQAGLKRLQDQPADLARLYDATGVPPVFYNSSLQLEEAVATYPALPSLARRCLLLPDYFNFLLSGQMANEVSIASTTQLLDVHSTAWSPTALQRFGLPAEWFAPPVLGGTILGPATGLPVIKGAKVVAVPGHDTACAYAAMPASATGDDLYLSSGTWSLVGFESDRPVLGPEALAARISNERTGDGRYRPLTNVIGLWLLEGTMKDFATRPENAAAWAKLITAAEALPCPAGLLDVNDPALTNPKSMKAAIDAQLKQRKLKAPGNLAGYTRLICESLGRGHAEAMRNFEKLAQRKFHRILVVGGGSKNRLLCQATADHAGVPVVSCDLEGSAVGNLAAQFVALGGVADLATFRKHLAAHLPQKVYTPKAGA